MSEQELLLAIRERERELAALEEQRWQPLPQARPRRAWGVRLVLGMLAALTVGGLAYIDCADNQQIAAPLRGMVARAQAVPWRERHGITDEGKHCQVWVSWFGMADVECDGQTVYHGFGNVDEDGVFSSLDLHEARKGSAQIEGGFARASSWQECSRGHHWDQRSAWIHFKH